MKLNHVLNKIRNFSLLKKLSDFFFKYIQIDQRQHFKKLFFLVSLTLICIFILFFIMAQLISRDHDLSQLKNMNDSIEFSMSKVRSKTIEKKRALPSKKQEIKPPEFKSIKPSLKAMSNVDLDIPNLLGDLGMEEGISASDVTPIVRISPQYPPSAAMKKIEGWVVLQFDITSQGTISNVKIIRSNPPRIFDKSAVAAVSKWKYRPKIENGKPVVQSGVRVQIDFNLSD